MSNRPKVKATVPPPPKQRTRTGANRDRPAVRTPEPVRGGGDRIWWVIAAVVVVIGVALVIVFATGGSSGSNGPKSNAELIKKVTTIKASVFDDVGAGTVTNPAKKISGQKPLVSNGKPHVVYIGAEYCPYCATERWAMVMALSRFGTFTNLGVTHSSSSDVYPNTPTFSFHGSTFTSQYLAFDGVETLSNVPQGSSYAPLDTPTSEEQALIDKYDAPPYVPSSSQGAIPFIDIGNKYVVSGASYDPGVLQNKTADQIAAALSDSSSDVSKGAVGSANMLTAAICDITKGQPSNVCSSSGVKAAASKLDS